MNELDRQVVRTKIAPAIKQSEISLLLGAGFSIVNSGVKGGLPSGDGLKSLFLAACKKTAGERTTLKDAYLLARRELDDFDKFMSDCFTVDKVFPWQEKLFEYPWARIYTTNIDNVLDIAAAACVRSGRAAGDFKFFNYVEPGHVSATIGALPVVTIHGTCRNMSDGYVFSSIEYARVSNRMLDWHNDLAARMVAGGVVVVGNQLDESDIDTYVCKREATYEKRIGPENWIVTPDPDEIKAENWKSAGFYVINATAEEFFNEIYTELKPLTVGDVVLEIVPTAKKAVGNIQAMTWFKGAFKLVFEKIEQAGTQSGLLKHFITGDDPEWFYIVNKAHVDTVMSTELLNTTAKLMQSNSSGIGLLHVIGPSGSGKTTAIRNALLSLVRTYRYIYEFDDTQSIDKDYIRLIIDRFTEKSIFVFYSASDYYFAIKEIANRQKESRKPYCLFILESRVNDYNKSKRQIVTDGIDQNFVELGELEYKDAINIAEKIDSLGLCYPKFSEFTLDKRARIILDKERGYGGDILSTLYSLTSNHNFEMKIFEDYESASSLLQKNIVNLVSMLHSMSFSVSVDYIAGALEQKVDEINRCITEDLAGVVVIPIGTSVVKCRHRIIATYYFDQYIAHKGAVSILSGLLEYLSRQFTVDDIKFNPLAYRMYRDLISFEFVYDKYFPLESRDIDCERLYHEAQKCFGRDGVFWLHFGRYYRKLDKFVEAIDCFKTGLRLYDSFQTRHSLGMTLVEKYIYEDQIYSDYEEGIEILERQRLLRGVADAYPTTTMLTLFSRILEITPGNLDVRERAKNCLNFGMKNFRDDDHFNRASREYLYVERKH